MKLILTIFILIFFCACNNKKPDQKPSTEIIQSEQEQKLLFTQLQEVFIKDSSLLSNDSIAFLILPLQASCPSCRKKTIDSIMSHINNFRTNHYVTIAISGGHKTANSFFREQKYEMPQITKSFQFDSTNLTGTNMLYKDQPTLYYAFNQKVYKKVSARPSTVREDLREFFTGYRKDNLKKDD